MDPTETLRLIELTPVRSLDAMHATQQEHTMSRTVHVECKTAEGYRWLKRSLYNAAPPDGFRVEDERRWAHGRAAVSAAVDSLVEVGYLKRSKNGATAITTAGKNALGK